MEAIRIADVELRPAKTLDCRGMQCPAPILELSKAARRFGKQPVILEIIVDDEGFPADLKAWCRASKNSTLSMVAENGVIVAHVGINIAAADGAPESGARAVASNLEPHSVNVSSTENIAAKDTAVNGIAANDTAANDAAANDAAANDIAAVPHSEPAPTSNHSERVTVHAPSVYANAPTVYEVDCRGMQCPAPILSIAKKAQALGRGGGLLQIVATDADFPSDLKAWCTAARARVVSLDNNGGVIRAVVAVGDAKDVAKTAVQFPVLQTPSSGASTIAVVKGTPPEVSASAMVGACDPHVAVTTSEVPMALTHVTSTELGPAVRENRCTLLVIKNDFESLMAAMMCASTAAAQGMETSIFFSFWGVNVLRAESPRQNEPKGKVSFLQKMMKWMMPRGPARQKMSKMHMGGVGKGMMQYFMKKNNVLTLQELMAAAAEQNVKFIVCSMSMGIMGIQKRDIVDLPNIEFAGVSTFIELSRRSSMSLVF